MAGIRRHAADRRPFRTHTIVDLAAYAGANDAVRLRMTSAGILRSMRALLLEPDPAWLEERRRLGHDRFDEVWDGVLHVVPSPTVVHQRLARELERIISRVVEPLGFEVFQNLDILDRTKGDLNYRQPDISVVTPADLMPSNRGINGHAELVIEVRSPNDESYDKLPFYAQCNIPEYWIAHPASRTVEVYVLIDGVYVLQQPDAGGVVHAPRFDLTLETLDGPKLRITSATGSFDA